MLTTHPVLRTDLGGRLGRLSLLPSRMSSNDGFTIGLELGASGALWVDLPSRSVPVLAGVAEGIDLGALPETLRDAVLEMAVAPLVGPLSELFGERVAIAGPEHAADPEAEGQTSLDLRDQGDDTIATLRLGVAACGLIKTALEGLAPVDSWSGAKDVPIRLSVEFAAIAISVGGLSQIRIGDLVLLPGGIDPSAVSVRAGRRIIATGTHDDGSIRIEQLIGGNRMDDDGMDVPADGDDQYNTEIDPEDDADEELSGDRRDVEMDDDEMDAPVDEDDDDDTEFDRQDTAYEDSSGDRLDVDQIEVSMCFGLGTIAITIADLRAITEGYTFALPPSETGDVVITVSGEEIGSGEIVQIDDRLGVRITRLKSTRNE